MAGGISECDDPDAQTILFCKNMDLVCTMIYGPSRRYEDMDRVD